MIPNQEKQGGEIFIKKKKSFFPQFIFQGKKTFCNAFKFYIYVVGFAFIILLFSSNFFSSVMVMGYFNLIDGPIRYTRLKFGNFSGQTARLECGSSAG